MTHKGNLNRTCAIVLLSGAALSAQIDPAQLLFPGGAIGVTGSDNVRLNLVNVVTPGPLAPSCKVKASLVDAATGAGTGTQTGISPQGTICQGADCPAGSLPTGSFALAPGQAASLDYSPAPGAGVRQALLASIVPSNLLSCARLAATLEVSDSTTGRTTVLFPPVPIFNGFGALSMTAADTIRLNVTYPPSPIFPPGPARSVRISFMPAGTTVTALAQKTVSLAPGQTTGLEFSNAALTAGTRQTVRPVLACAGALSCGVFITSVELFDSVSGRTFAAFPPTPIIPAQ
jgi:hypothetical protein